MQRPKNHNGSAVGNRAYQGREQTRLETAPTERGSMGARLETVPMERGLPVGAVCNRAYQGRGQTPLETAPMERRLRLS